jgi:hypothetical protein
MAASTTTPRTTAHHGKLSPELLPLFDATVVVVGWLVVVGVVVVGAAVVEVVVSVVEVVDVVVVAGVVVVCAEAPEA